jgi:hypothetical protein
MDAAKEREIIRLWNRLRLLEREGRSVTQSQVASALNARAVSDQLGLITGIGRPLEIYGLELNSAHPFIGGKLDVSDRSLHGARGLRDFSR